MNILGISALYHDSAAVLLTDGVITAAAQEERFTRKKHDHAFPVNAVKYCIAEAGLGRSELDAVVFYDKPILKFSRAMESYFAAAPFGLSQFMHTMPLWLKQKLWTPLAIERCIAGCGIDMPDDLFFCEHHESHAASAFYPSPFESAAVLTVDGVGEWSTSSISRGSGSSLEMLKEMKFPHSLGLLYSAFTSFIGFKVNSGEYKLMGLAPYGEPRYERVIREKLVDLREDGSFRLNMEYFAFLKGRRMTNRKFAELFDGPHREPESEITRREMDIAASVQAVTEDVVLRMAEHARLLTGEKNLCLAGGVALNCVANGRLKRESGFDDIWVQPAAGDAGGALGSALSVWHRIMEKPRKSDGQNDLMGGSYLGPAFDDSEIESFIEARGYPARKFSEAEMGDEVARLLDEQKIIGLCRGRMEFGPRALGNRSIIADPRSPDMQQVLNSRIKNRESFRPFAPSCIEERVRDYFDLDGPSPYMLLTAPVREGSEDLPAVTHVDRSARVQTVTPDLNKSYYDIIKAFEKRTGCGIIINTSFNVRGEPIVCTPGDAYECFMRTEIDCLVLGSFLLMKDAQPAWQAGAGHSSNKDLD